MVNNFNAKLRRLKAKNPSKVDFYPDTISIKDIRSKISTRADFNRVVNSLKRFSKRGSEELTTTKGGVTLTKYELKELHIKRSVVNRRRSQEVKRLGLTLERGLKTQVDKQQLTPKKKVETVNLKDFEKFKESLEREIADRFNQEQKERYVSNYFKGLYNKLGYEWASEIIKLLEQESADFIVDNSLGNPFLTIDFIYDRLEVEVRGQAILDEWMALLI